MLTDKDLQEIIRECFTEQIFVWGSEGHFEGWSERKIQAYITGQTNLFFNEFKTQHADTYNEILYEDREIVKKAFHNIFKKDQAYPVDISEKPQ